MFGWTRRKLPGSGQDTDLHAPNVAEPLFPMVATPVEPRPVLPVVWLPGEAVPRITLATVADPLAVLCASVPSPAPAQVWHGHSPPSGEPAPDIAPVTLYRLPPGCVVHGGGQFVTTCADHFLDEQWPPDTAPGHAAIDALAPLDLPVVEVAREVLLIGRHGGGAYGPWLTDLLPKLLLTEAAYPDRFAYLLPAEALLPAASDSAWAAIRQSLATCGIPETRVLAADRRFTYRFEALHAASPVWSGGMPHPQAMQALRNATAGIAPATRPRLAVQRAATAKRGLANPEAVHALLQLRGFTAIQAGSLPFERQVALFKGASAVFGVMGSELSNLVFAPPGVRLIAAAPEAFDGAVWHGLVGERGGCLADLRGIPPERGPAEPDRFVLTPDALATALDTLPG